MLKLKKSIPKLMSRRAQVNNMDRLRTTPRAQVMMHVKKITPKKKKKEKKK
jgi:hypothetical protein